MDDLLIRGALVIDARGRVVVPGFIDIHTHSDFFLPLNRPKHLRKRVADNKHGFRHRRPPQETEWKVGSIA